ncbi:DUF4037 domain-containing protein [Leifsonia poae]|uniref:DUF4037 domain-containing protein n=1 Tax=Leifsonia poae TaxID=110933 RepID=UPI003D66FBEE
MDAATPGIELSHAYFDDIVQPILAEALSGTPYSAGRLGGGSDVLGLDDATSRDHDWGLRVNLFVPTESVDAVAAELERRLPSSFRGHPTRFPFTGETDARHHVDVDTVSRFAHSRLGFDPRDGVTVDDWLSLTGQAVLEMVAGPVFADHSGELAAVRARLGWYPDDVWRYVLACDWIRIAQELPLMGRAADVGDETGSRIIAARLAHTVAHLAFMVERRWPPYAKWFGTCLRELAGADELGAAIDEVLAGTDVGVRQRGIARALDSLLDRQNAVGLTDAPVATVPFWDRPYLHPDPVIVEQLLDPIRDPVVRALPHGHGSIEQRTDTVDILVDARARRRMIG